MNIHTRKQEILNEKEFREYTMGCFYQDELRKHDQALRAALDTLLQEVVAEIFSKIQAEEEFVTYKKDNGHGIAVPVSKILDLQSNLDHLLKEGEEYETTNTTRAAWAK